MIDTDKYEGHTPAPWRFGKHMRRKVKSIHHGDATPKDLKLMIDAPLLLAEVKRLRKGIHFALSYTEPTPHTDDPWMACREFIVKYLESLIAGIDPLSFLKEWEMEEE